MSFFQDYLDDLVFEKIAADDSNRYLGGAVAAGGLGAAGLAGYGAHRAHRAMGQLGVLNEARGLKLKASKLKDPAKAAKQNAKRTKRYNKAIKSLRKEYMAGSMGPKPKKDYKSYRRLGDQMVGEMSVFGNKKAYKNKGLLDNAFGRVSLGKKKMRDANFLRDSKLYNKKEYRRAMQGLGRTRLGLGIGAAGAAGVGGYGAYKAYNG